MLENNERWVVGYEGAYSVTPTGGVYSYKRKKKRLLVGAIIYDHSRASTTYRVVLLTDNGSSKTLYVHRLVAQSFIENPDNKREVNHIDGNKLNNDVSNLEWVTHSENTVHAYSTNLMKVLSDDDKKYRRHEVVFGSLSRREFNLYRKELTEEYLESCGIPKEFKGVRVPTEFSNMSEYWAHIVSLFDDVYKGVGTMELSRKYNFNQAIGSRILSGKIYKKQRQSYEKHLQRLQSQCIILPAI